MDRIKGLQNFFGIPVTGAMTQALYDALDEVANKWIVSEGVPHSVVGAPVLARSATAESLADLENAWKYREFIYRERTENASSDAGAMGGFKKTLKRLSPF